MERKREKRNVLIYGLVLYKMTRLSAIGTRLITNRNCRTGGVSEWLTRVQRSKGGGFALCLDAVGVACQDLSEMRDGG